MFDIIVILVILVVVFGSSFIEEQAKKQATRAKKQYDYDAKVVKDYWTPIKKFFDDIKVNIDLIKDIKLIDLGGYVKL